MPDSPTSEPESAFVCDWQRAYIESGGYESMHSPCADERFYKELEGRRYCVLHFPGEEKSADFTEALERKLANKDFDFRGVWFPDKLTFEDFEFGTEANFYSATFSAEANFRSAAFNSEANFSSATFDAKANFNSATFRGAAYFTYATFYAEAYFNDVTFADRVSFAGLPLRPPFTETSSLFMQSPRIAKPDDVSFRTLTLRPHWFVNADARKFEFTDVDWEWRDVNKEIESLELRFVSYVSSPHRLLAITCRHLAVNAEDNHRYEEASKFRYMAMDANRLEHWHGFAFWRLSWWYWLASGYGERVLRASVVLIGILLISAGIYTQVGFSGWEPRLASESDVEVGTALKLSRALTYSAAVMTLQKPEPRPATTAAQTVVLLETILGPVQAALLALAIRRKFMR